MYQSIPIPTVEPDQIAGRGTRMPDMPTLLAVLAARQRILPTAIAMRTLGLDPGSAPADRMVMLFVPMGRNTKACGGAFNGMVARYLTDAKQGEGDVYRGA